MESIKSSSFAKFEGNEITNLHNIRGGEFISTGPGADRAQNGDYFTFTSDELDCNSDNHRFCGVKVIQY